MPSTFFLPQQSWRYYSNHELNLPSTDKKDKVKNSKSQTKVVVFLRSEHPVMFTHQSLLPSVLCHEKLRQWNQGLLLRPQMEPPVALWQQSPRAVCLWPLPEPHKQASWAWSKWNRPNDHLLHGESLSTQEEPFWVPKSHEDVCGPHPQIPTALVASRACDPGIGGEPEAGFPPRPHLVSTCLFSPLGLLGSAISQMSYHMFTEYFTVF